MFVLQQTGALQTKGDKMNSKLGKRCRGNHRFHYVGSRADYYDNAINRQEEMEQLARLRAPELVKSAIVITDSFGWAFNRSMGMQNVNEPFIRHNPYPDRLSNNGPGFPDEYVELYDLTVPSLKLREVFKDSHLRLIMDNHITVVIVMVGMVDIANQEVPNADRSWYFKEMLRAVDQFRARAKSLYPTEYDRNYISNVVVHWSYLQNWGLQWAARPGKISPVTGDQGQKPESTLCTKTYSPSLEPQ